MTGIDMSDTQEKLRQLLDGELDKSEISNDPVLISLAERIYGLDMKELMGDDYPSSKSAVNSDLFVEIVESEDKDAIPLPEVKEPITEEITPVSEIKVPKIFLPISLLLKINGPILSLISILNIFGVFSFLSSSICSGHCPTENGRISWLDIYRLNSEHGWVATGSFGAPTIGIFLLGVFMFWFGNKLKQIHNSSKN